MVRRKRGTAINGKMPIPRLRVLHRKVISWLTASLKDKWSFGGYKRGVRGTRARCNTKQCVLAKLKRKRGESRMGILELLGGIIEDG